MIVADVVITTTRTARNGLLGMEAALDGSSGKQRAIGRPKMHAVVSTVAKARRRDGGDDPSHTLERVPRTRIGPHSSDEPRQQNNLARSTFSIALRVPQLDTHRTAVNPQARACESAGLHGESLGLHGESAGLHGESPGLHRESAGLRGESHGLHGESHGFHRESPGSRGEPPVTLVPADVQK